MESYYISYTTFNFGIECIAWVYTVPVSYVGDTRFNFRKGGWLYWLRLLFYSEFPGKGRQSSIFVQSHSVVIRRCIFRNIDSALKWWKTNVCFVLGKQEFRKCETAYSGSAFGEHRLWEKRWETRRKREVVSPKSGVHALPIIISNSPPLMVSKCQRW